MGYKIYRKDRNRYWEGVAFYVQDNVPVKIRINMMQYNIELLWLQANLLHRKPRPPNENNEYLERMCEILDYIIAVGQDIHFMGDFNPLTQIFTCLLWMLVKNWLTKPPWTVSTNMFGYAILKESVCYPAAVSKFYHFIGTT